MLGNRMKNGRLIKRLAEQNIKRQMNATDIQLLKLISISIRYIDVCGGQFDVLVRYHQLGKCT